MKITRVLASTICAWLAVSAADAALPVVSNVASQQRPGTKLVDITYDVADADGDTLKVRVEISADGGTNYSVPAFSLTGAIGDGVTPGVGKQIVWDAGKDWDGEYSDKMRVKIVAVDAKGVPGLEWGNEVPPGGFLMGQDGGAEGSGPSRHVNIPWSYWLSKYEITNAQYVEYLNIALAAGKVARNGTTSVKSTVALYQGGQADVVLLEIGDNDDIRWNINKFEVLAGRENFPVSVTWYGALAFAMYYGYDLPTTAEWEKAARGPANEDASTHLLFPWGNSISGGYANYLGSNDPWDNSTSRKTPVGYYNGNQTPFGPNNPNAYALYDIVGNVMEWTRSISSTIETYSLQESLQAGHNSLSDPTSNRLTRGGSNVHQSYETPLRNFSRTSVDRATYNDYTGFRVIRRSTP